MGDIYVILLQNDVLDGKTYHSFEEAKQALIDTAMAKKWRLENNRDEKPIVGFQNKFGINDGDNPETVDFPKETGDLTELYAKGNDINAETINIRKLTLKASNAGRRRTVKTIRMKKGEYLREHHHLFRVLQNPTRRALNAELRKQQKELKERGLRG